MERTSLALRHHGDVIRHDAGDAARQQRFQRLEEVIAFRLGDDQRRLKADDIAVVLRKCNERVL